MTSPALTATPRPSHPADSLRADALLQTPGVVHLEASSDTVLKLHLSGPARGACSRGRSFLYRRSDLDLLPAGTAAAWEVRDTATALLLKLPAPLMQRAAQQLDRGPDVGELAPRFQFRHAALEHLAWALEAERREDFLGGELYRESLGLALAVRLLRTPAPALPVQIQGLSQPALRRVTDYIEAHLHEKLRLATLATMSGFSASHFGLLFRRTTGMPLHQYVIRRRAERARALLLNDDRPLSQIAAEVGFAHHSHMARWLRSLYGDKPAALRRKTSSRGDFKVG